MKKLNRNYRSRPFKRALFMLMYTIPLLSLSMSYPLTHAEDTVQNREALGKRLAEIKEMTQQLKTTSETNVQQAIDGRKRCLEQVKGFDERLGNLYTQRDNFDKRGDELKAALARTTQEDRNYKAQVEKLRKDVENAKASLAYLEHQFELLRRWWWVPGYGQYLAIKSLVDGEIAQHKTILEDLNQSQIQLANYSALTKGARSMVCEITEERENIAGAIEALQCVHELVHKRGKEYRERTMALADREEFWTRLNDMASITIDGRRQALMHLYKSPSNANIDNAISTQATKLETALTEYQQKLQDGQRFLTDVPADFCTREEFPNQCVVQKPADTSSFQLSCSDIGINEGQDVLSAKCRKMNGAMQAASLRLRGVHNANGVLRNTNQGESSFQKSCRDAYVCGTTLLASCRMINGQYTDASVKLTGIHNMDGTLTY